MLTIIRKIVVCQSTNTLRLKSFIRLMGSLQEQHKEHSIKGKDFLIDPNLTKAFEKMKKGEFIPPFLDVDSENISSMGTKREHLRENTLGKLVYVGKLDKPFRAAKSLSLASSIGGAICYPIMIPKILHETSIYVAIGYTIISATFVLLTPYASLYEALDMPEPKNLTVEFSAILLGETAFVTLPGEIFVRVALAMRRASPFPRTLFLGLTNNYIGYLPDEQATASSGYEVVASRVPSSAGKVLQEHAERMLEQVKARAATRKVNKL